MSQKQPDLLVLRPSLPDRVFLGVGVALWLLFGFLSLFGEKGIVRVLAVGGTALMITWLSIVLFSRVLLVSRRTVVISSLLGRRTKHVADGDRVKCRASGEIVVLSRDSGRVRIRIARIYVRRKTTRARVEQLLKSDCPSSE